MTQGGREMGHTRTRHTTRTDNREPATIYDAAQLISGQATGHYFFHPQFYFTVHHWQYKKEKEAKKRKWRNHITAAVSYASFASRRRSDRRSRQRPTRKMAFWYHLECHLRRSCSIHGREERTFKINISDRIDTIGMAAYVREEIMASSAAVGAFWSCILSLMGCVWCSGWASDGHPHGVVTDRRRREEKRTSERAAINDDKRTHLDQTTKHEQGQQQQQQRDD